MGFQSAIGTLKKWLFLGVFGLFLGGAIYSQTSLKIHIHPAAQPFPTELVFKGSVFKVQKAINEIFNSDPVNIFQPPPEKPPVFKLYWKGDHHPEEVNIFKNPVNENDVYISCNRNPICNSTVYANGWGEPLEYMADFQLHIIPQGAKETLVKVIVFNAEVRLGKKDVAVNPTTIEENEILNNLEKALLKIKHKK